jgi:quercetin dioxygenase-like cupin family protein
MKRIVHNRCARWNLLMTVGLVAASTIAISTAASAGECPANKVATDATKPVTTPAKGVTDTVISSIDVAKEPAKIDGRLFRLRKLVIQPGGVVPWHSHGDRPAIIYIIKGEATEYASNCSVPIVHKAGDVAVETSKTAHWWKNNGSATVELLSADLFPTQMMHSDEEHTM